MDYKLAKKMEKAGYEFTYIEDTEYRQSIEDTDFRIPTLSELIEACPEMDDTYKTNCLVKSLPPLQSSLLVY